MPGQVAGVRTQRRGGLLWLCPHCDPEAFFQPGGCLPAAPLILLRAGPEHVSTVAVPGSQRGPMHTHLPCRAAVALSLVWHASVSLLLLLSGMERSP